MTRMPGIHDHQSAFDQRSNSDINWTLVGCPFIKECKKKFFKRNQYLKLDLKRFNQATLQMQ